MTARRIRRLLKPLYFLASLGGLVVAASPFLYLPAAVTNLTALVAAVVAAVAAAVDWLVRPDREDRT